MLLPPSNHHNQREQYERLARQGAARLSDSARYLRVQWRRRTPAQQDGLIAAGAVLALGIVVVGSYLAGERAAAMLQDFLNRHNDDEPSDHRD